MALGKHDGIMLFEGPDEVCREAGRAPWGAGGGRVRVLVPDDRSGAVTRIFVTEDLSEPFDLGL